MPAALQRIFASSKARNRRLPMAGALGVSRCASRCSTSRPSAPGGAPSPGIHTGASCGSARAAPSREGLRALAARLPGNLGAEQLAHGIIEIANWDQANAIRQMTIQRGIDPADFALLSFGGSGPAQSAAVMELMGMKTTIVPPNPGNLSAFGLLAVDWRTDHIVTKVMHEETIDLADVAARYAALERGGVATLLGD